MTALIVLGIVCIVSIGITIHAALHNEIHEALTYATLAFTTGCMTIGGMVL